MQKTVIVVPCYNEAKRLKTAEFADFLDKNPRVDFCFVNDGSSDDTLKILLAFAQERAGRVEAVDMNPNGGKASAVRHGALHALKKDSCRYVGYWDADLATPLDQIPEFLKIAEKNPSLLIVMGSRINRMGAHIDRKWYRHYLGRLFGTVASVFLKIPVYDTQCGAKLVEAALARKIFAEPFQAQWLFDVELLARAVGEMGRAGALNAVFEVPLDRWEDVAGSKLKPHHFLQAAFDLAKIWLCPKNKR
jgi:glycosyltransferase involved in cell wall biosynthesis